VARYRIHQFDVDGRVVATAVVDCADDNAAIQALGKTDDADKATVRTTEIWIGRRCIKRSTDGHGARHSGRMTWPRLS
jgi:hypothetical protein